MLDPKGSSLLCRAMILPQGVWNVPGGRAAAYPGCFHTTTGQCPLESQNWGYWAKIPSPLGKGAGWKKPVTLLCVTVASFLALRAAGLLSPVSSRISN